MSQPVVIEKKGHVAWVTLNRPEKQNAINQAAYQSFLDELPKLDADPEVRVVVVKGEGKHFAAGIDLADLASITQNPSAAGREQLRQAIMKLQDAMTVFERCRKPVIAAIQGACIGAGVDLACVCDIRLCSADAFFSIRETRMALVADLGTLQRFQTITGEGWTRELALTGRDFKAQEALAIGFVTHVYDDYEQLLAEAGKMAEQIAANAPLAVQGAKDLMGFTRDYGVDAGLRYVAQKNAAMLHSEDLMEAVAAFMQKRPPEFKGN